MVPKVVDDLKIATSDLGPDEWAYDRSIKPLPFDPQQSRALLTAAGYRPGPDAIVEREGKPLSLLLVYAAGMPTSEEFAVQIQTFLHNVGIAIELKPQQANLMFAPFAQHGTIPSGQFDLELSSFGNGADPNDRRSFACASIPPNGFNYSRWCNARYDRVTNDALAHFDHATRKRDYASAAKILVDDVPEVFLYWPKNTQLVRTGVQIDDGAHNIALPPLWRIDRAAR